MGDYSQNFMSEYEAIKGSIQSYLPLGLPADPSPSALPPGLETTSGAISSFNLFPDVTAVWDVVKRNSESAADYVEQGIETLYGKGKQAVGTVYDDLTKPLSSAVDNVYWKIILAAVVIGGVVYFAGKGGAIKVNV